MSSLCHQHYLSHNPCAVNLVLVHGWAMSSGVWQPLLPYLQDDFNVTVIDGFDQDIDYLAIAPETAIWCGWSLGAVLALKIAHQYLERVQAVVTIAFNPCFVQRDDWLYAMPLEDFEYFQQGLNHNKAATLKRFVALQCLGSSSQKQDVRFLQQQLAVSSLPKLQSGLQQLAQDYRQLLAQQSKPILSILGQNDALVPVAMADYLLRLNAKLQVNVIQQAAHAPFVSHPHDVAKQLVLWIAENVL